MNRSFLSKTRYLIGVGLKKLGVRRYQNYPHHPRPHSAVGNVSGTRCECDCRSRGREFDLGLVHTFVEIDHDIISTVILLPSAESFKKGCCQLQTKVCAQSTD